MIVPTANDKEVRQNIATVAKDEKIRLPETVYAKNRYQLGMVSLKITLSTNSEKLTMYIVNCIVI